MPLSRVESSDGTVYYVSPLLTNAGVPHAFSTRIGGVSAGPFDSLNLGNPTGVNAQDDSDRIATNYRRLQRAIGCEGRARVFVHQVHGAELLTASRETDFENSRCADAITSDDPSRVLAIRTADCVPILLATRDGAQVAAVHAGWRGVIAGIIGNTVKQFGSSKNLEAAIGPCIGFDAFEVGDEVLAEFDRAFGSAAPIRRDGNGKGHVDLREAVRKQLISAGLDADSIDVSDRCTYRDRDEFFSHRRDRGITGRMAALIGAR